MKNECHEYQLYFDASSMMNANTYNINGIEIKLKAEQIN